MFIRILAISALWLCCSIGRAEETVEIPLTEIWAWNMPGTKNVRELEKTPTDYPLVFGIARKLKLTSNRDEAGPAFVVEGSGLQALKNAYAVIVDKQPRLTSLPEGTEGSIIFFALQGSPYVHLTKIEKRQNRFKIKFEFMGSLRKDSPNHFAIIPVGKLPEGHFSVEIVAEGFAEPFTSDPGRRANPDKRKMRRVSSSFEFDVK
jgi:hypothetical protein